MKKLALALLLALPLSAVTPACADAGCYNLSAGFHIKICGTGYCKAWCEPCNPCCGPCGGCGPCGPGCCGDGGNIGAPWYTYWPYDGATMTAPEYYPNWNYEANFQTPAPVYPFYPNTAGIDASAARVTLPPPASQPAPVYPFWPNTAGVDAAAARLTPPPPASQPASRPAYLPASYQQQAPGYWYGR